MAYEVAEKINGEMRKTTQDLIVLILAKEHPLTIGEITKRLRDNFKIGLTFQAVRKALLVLVDRNILYENENKFYINKKYILQIKKLSDQLLRNYFTSGKSDSLPTWTKSGEEYTHYNFDNLLLADKFWGEIVLDWARNLKKDEDSRFFFHGPFCWYPLGHLGTESDFLTELKENNVRSYYLVEGNSIIDKWIGKFYENYRVKYNNNKKPDNKFRTALGVFGDFIIQFEYPEKLCYDIKSLFQELKSIDSINLAKMVELLKGNEKISLSVIKSKAIADKLKTELASNF